MILSFWNPGESAVQTSVADIPGAIRNNDLGALRRLANAQNVNALNAARTPLMIAAGTGTLEAMQILLSAGADPNAVDSYGVTPLMLGVRDPAKVRLLL